MQPHDQVRIRLLEDLELWTGGGSWSCCAVDGDLSGSRLMHLPYFLRRLIKRQAGDQHHPRGVETTQRGLIDREFLLLGLQEQFLLDAVCITRNGSV